MFARTARLTLRPGWPEDAPAVTQAAAHAAVAMTLARLPWPYEQRHAEEWLSIPRTPTDPTLLILAHDSAQPRLIGSIGIEAHDGGHELGYWLTPDAWGRGYATEAGRAILHMARHALGLRHVISGHFVDNPASGRVLRKLGFHETGHAMRPCIARGHDVATIEFAIDLDEHHRTGPICLAA